MITTIFFIFIPSSSIKYILILLCGFILYLIKKYPERRFKTLSQLRAYKLNLITKYKLKTRKEKIYNIIVIFVGFGIFIGGLFVFRFLNSSQLLNLKEKYTLLKQFYNITPLHVSFLNTTIFILILLIYICMFIRILKYYKYHVIKRHLYLIGNLESCNTYEKVFLNQFCETFNFCRIYSKFCNKIEKILKNYYYKKVNKKELNFLDVDFALIFIEYNEMLHYYDKYFINPLKILNDNKKTRLIFQIIIKIHYIFLMMLLLYDILFNDFKIILVFYVLPWTFLFDIYIRFSLFVDDLWSPHDKYLNTILYAKKIEIWDKNTLIIDGEFYDYNNAKMIYKTYVARGFIKDYNNL